MDNLEKEFIQAMIQPSRESPVHNRKPTLVTESLLCLCPSDAAPVFQVAN